MGMLCKIGNFKIDVSLREAAYAASCPLNWRPNEKFRMRSRCATVAETTKRPPEGERITNHVSRHDKRGDGGI